jgi:molybdopterin-containing oxidoreductase family iron-sulfur binding subunit
MGRLEFLDETPGEVQKMDAGDGFEARAATYAEEGSERHEALSEANDHVYDARGWWVDSRPPTGVMGKCTFCPSRQDNHTDNPKGTVACMNACDETGMSAIHFGDLDAEIGDDYDRPARYLERRKDIEPSPAQKNEADPEEDGYGWADDGEGTPQPRDDIYTQEDWENPPAPHDTSQLSTFKLLENLGTEPNITYIGNEPGPTDEQIDPSEDDRFTSYEDIQGSIEWPVTVKDNRKHHLDYGAGGPPEDHGEEEA